MKKYFLIFIFIYQVAFSQELYVSTEPASNMATGSIGFRLNSKLFKMDHSGKYNSYRIEPEIMWGVSKKLMVHVAAYGSNMFQKNFRMEGGSLYGKYRFFSQDDVHEHFRLAAFGKVSFIKNPEYLTTMEQHLLPDGMGGYVQHELLVTSQSNDIDMDGNNSGIATGVIATQLKNKLAVSASLGYTWRMNNIDYKTEIFQPLHAITYSASAGLLLFPKEYTSYKQTNMNLYLEVLGQSFTDKKQYYVDVAPAVQFIFNSIARLDIGYRAKLSGNVERLSKSSFMLRLEYNLLNVFSKK
ncbi:MAG TPA: hypothetical protein VMY77_14570 [Chitinophagaceae bacterium]|nr:hypothetical protein [Chitinophagaceae bacterium]